MGQWNLAGQELDLLDVAAKDHDILFVQEISRTKTGWEQMDRDEFHWIFHQHQDQWRGVGIGIALDKFDSVIYKKATSRGIWAVVRIVGVGRVLLGSLHCHTGTTNAVYQAAALEFVSACPRKYRHLPLLCGIDANEVPRWIANEGQPEGDSVLEVGDCGSNLNCLLHACLLQGIRPVRPEAIFRQAWTHFPRDENREGRHIDMMLSRQLHMTPLTVDPDRRHVIGSDHALLSSELWIAGGPARNKWRGDSRARWLVADLPDTVIVDDADLTLLAKKFTRPRRSAAFRDDAETLAAIRDARDHNCASQWKRVHRLRQAKRKKWRRDRLAAILSGDWEQYRLLQAEKKRVRGWWGDMLQDRSAAQLATEIQDHLEEKMKDKASPGQWDDILENKIRGCSCDGNFTSFQICDVVTELQFMKGRSAVGPDLIGVHLLRAIAAHETLAPQLLDLINHIVSRQELPNSWEHSFLALLAKVPVPLRAADLRPICVSSAFNKLVNRLVCARVLPILRGGSCISCCGKGRQAADLVGCISRIRDVCHEWKMPLLLCKLDVSGAFDRVKRDKVADFLIAKLDGTGLDAELRYVLAQLRTDCLHGTTPGGVNIEVRPDIGIKQGAPESAEVFGLLIDTLLSGLVHCRQWKALGLPFDELEVDLLFYQDDIFLIDNCISRLCRKISAVNASLGSAGLSLATDKTKIVANDHYKGARRAEIRGDTFQVADVGDSLKVLGLSFSLGRNPSEQAQEIIARTRAAIAAHKDILQAHGAWLHKVKVMRSLVESQFNWIGGALHWGKDELHALNLLQQHTVHSAFHIHRLESESWVDWNARSLRFVRVWLQNNSVPRWSCRVLELQHMLHGHWARRTEVVHGVPLPCPAMRCLQWRNTNWWRMQQSLSPQVSLRHPGRFYASNTERQLASTHGNLWFVAAQDRSSWIQDRKNYVSAWDVKWTSGRQLSIRY